MTETSRDRAEKIEGLLPRLMRMLYRSNEDSVLTELPLGQMRIVRLLYGGNRTVTSLGEELGLTASAVTQMVNRLEDSGLLQRLEDVGDRRVKHLTLTPKGRDLMRTRQEHRIARMQELLERLDPEQQLVVLRSIEALVEAGGEIPHHESLPFVAEIEQAVPPVPPYTR